MAGNKKPRKPYRQRAKHVPMMVESRDRLAARLHLGISSFIAEPSLSTATLAARNLAIMAAAIDYGHAARIKDRCDPGAVQIKSALLAQEAVEGRYTRLRVWQVSEAEAQSMRTAVDMLDGELARIPLNVWQAAEWTIEQLDRKAA